MHTTSHPTLPLTHACVVPRMGLCPVVHALYQCKWCHKQLPIAGQRGTCSIKKLAAAARGYAVAYGEDCSRVRGWPWQQHLAASETVWMRPTHAIRANSCIKALYPHSTVLQAAATKQQFVSAFCPTDLFLLGRVSCAIPCIKPNCNATV